MTVVIIAIRDGHVVERPARPLGPRTASVVAERLAADGIDLLVETGPIVHVTALTPVTTEQEVAALAAFLDVTDSRVAFHGAEAS